jgi:2-dehydro-3-deoxyphosphogluconate aldolase/(4S)-4-hydroxy-2-oxoglutarate aldolase
MRYLERTRVVGVIRGLGTEATMAAAAASVAGGIRVLEIALSHPEALKQLAALKSRYGDEIDLGAGTVLDPESAQRALAAGAEFIVSPALLPEVIALCRARGAPVFPGAMTPTEALAAHRAGAEMVKIFPASVLGPRYLAALRGPFPELRLLPTGGVTPENAPEFFRAGAAAVGAGGELYRKEWTETGDWAAIEAAARAYVRAAEEAR